MKDDLSQKNTRKYDIFLKEPRRHKTYFFPGEKERGCLSQEIHRNMTFSVYTYGCYKRGATPLCQKKSKMALPHKNTPKSD